MTEELTLNEMYELYLDFIDEGSKDIDINTNPHNMICEDC
jgi:hypothetical protein